MADFHSLGTTEFSMQLLKMDVYRGVRMSGASLRILGLIPALPAEDESSKLEMNLATVSGLTAVKAKLPGETTFFCFSCLKWSKMNL